MAAMVKASAKKVGAGLPDGPPKICDFRKSAALRRWDVEDAVPYDHD